MNDVLFSGGTVVTATGSRPGNVVVRNGRIAAITDPATVLPARETVDVSGYHVLPGVIDGHSHFRTWSRHCDDLGELTTSAAYGGVTTQLAFVMGMNAPGTDLRSRVQACIDEGLNSSPIDFAFHAAIADEPNTLAQIDEAYELGVTSFKMFMINRARKMMVDDGFLYAAMAKIAALGGLAMVHAELEDLSAALSSAASTIDDVHERFSAARPTWLEAEATRRALVVAERTECPLYVVHVTCAAALDEIRTARSRGQRVYAETCPQYLGLTHDDERRLGGLAKVAPPLRAESDRKALLSAVLDGDIDVVSSDHAPYERSVKADPSTPFADVPVGMPGTETLLPVTWRLLSEAGGDIALLHRVLTGNPAQIFGIDRKGSLEVGFDADLTIVDMNQSTRIDGSALHSRAGYSAFDGWTSPLSVVRTYQRGQEVLTGHGELADGRGTFLSRTPESSVRSQA